MHGAEANRLNQFAHKLQRRVGNRKDKLRENEAQSGGPPLAIKHRNQVEDESRKQHHHVQQDGEVDDRRDDLNQVHGLRLRERRDVAVSVCNATVTRNGNILRRQQEYLARDALNLAV